LQELDLRFILGAKPNDHTDLFDWVAATPETREVELTDAKGGTSPFPLPQRRTTERRQLRPRSQFPRGLGAPPERQADPLLLGHRFHHQYNLSTVLIHLMMLAFLIDQIQQCSCRLFQVAQLFPKAR
jgi:hypothetical protein